VGSNSTDQSHTSFGGMITTRGALATSMAASPPQRIRSEDDIVPSPFWILAALYEVSSCFFLAQRALPALLAIPLRSSGINLPNFCAESPAAQVFTIRSLCWCKAAKSLSPSGIKVASKASRGSTWRLTLWENPAYLSDF
jgi:hypothetical protein